MTTVGIDLAKNVFQVHAIDAVGAIVIRQQAWWAQLLLCVSRLQPCLMGMEACAGAHC
jgi:transposase